MEKIFSAMDALPLVRILQVMAGVIFLLSLATLLPLWNSLVNLPDGPDSNAVWNTIAATGMTIARNLYQPLILLALAELIKLNKKYDMA